MMNPEEINLNFNCFRDGEEHEISTKSLNFLSPKMVLKLTRKKERKRLVNLSRYSVMDPRHR